MSPARPALLSTPFLALALVLVGCVAEAAPAQTPLTRAQACEAIGEAVAGFYDTVSPGSTTTPIAPANLPVMAGFVIPTPTCSFQVRPDPAVVPGDVFTIENFYLDYDETMTVTLAERLEAAGYKRKNPDFASWATSRLNRSYSAAVQTFSPGDGQDYSSAAAHYRLLDLTVGQN
ncbi:MAG TPA: hypothetical protein VL294_07825 [Pseudolysinimonas sp.]|jgi:hypothetical protein|nr:hypothetical protein [Pseudolysinimonas sp.]